MSQFNAQMERFREDKGFVAALDQSGGSTPKALESYGIAETEYNDEQEMFDLVHQMRSRILTDPAFTSDRLIGSILFEGTAQREVLGLPSARYLWEMKRIVPFIKIDKGLDERKQGVRLMKPIPDLKGTLEKAKAAGAFGTKMRSVIEEASPSGIKAVVEQQFDLAQQIWATGLVPIIEPEVSINASGKADAEAILYDLLQVNLENAIDDLIVIFKLTPPTTDNLYKPFIDHASVLRVLALSGGYSRNQAIALLAQNQGMTASFSRALLEDLRISQSDSVFSQSLHDAIESIYLASLT